MWSWRVNGSTTSSRERVPGGIGHTGEFAEKLLPFLGEESVTIQRDILLSATAPTEWRSDSRCIQYSLQKAEWESPVALMPGMNRRSLCGEVRGASAAARRRLTHMGKAAILRTDIPIRKDVHQPNKSPPDG